MGVAREHCDNILENVHVLRQTMMGKHLIRFMQPGSPIIAQGLLFVLCKNVALC